jgi:hypothetical protein
MILIVSGWGLGAYATTVSHMRGTKQVVNALGFPFEFSQSEHC